MNSQLFYKIDPFKSSRLVLLFFTLLIGGLHPLYSQEKESYVVVLDAGHGGKDPGKVGYKGLKEKDIALDIVLSLGALLEKEPHIKVLYTRKNDVFIDLWERGRIANKADADLFVSVHCNAHHTQAYGAESWVLGTHANRQNLEVAKSENSVILLEDNYQQHYKGYDPNSPGSFIGITMLQEEYLDQSIELAGIIQQQFTAALKRRDRGVKQAGFVVLHQTYMPSVLIETGFITHKKEGLYLNSTKGKKQFAKAIYQGVNKYIDRLRINTVDTEIVSKPSVEKPTTKKPESKLLFRVQIAAGSRKLATEPYNFKGLENIERVKAGTVYRYYFGKSNHYAGITKFHKTAKSKGYTSSFVVAFREGKRVPLDQVLEK